MEILTTLLAPTGFWQNIVLGLEAVVKDYGLTLILITLIIKFIMLPFDFLNKYVSKVNGRKQAIMKPKLDKIKKTYANNPAMLNQKQMELYKRENFSVMGSCFAMLFNLVITTVVFITLLNGLTSIADFKQKTEFEQLQRTYYETILVNAKPEQYNLQDLQTKSLQEILEFKNTLSEQEITNNTQPAQEKVLVKYDEVKSSFLWIKNIWKADTTTSAVLNYKDFKKVAKDLTSPQIDGQENPLFVSENEYDTIMKPVLEHRDGPNGYFLLTIFSAIITFISMQLTTWLSKQKAKKQGAVFVDPMANNKTMTYVMPIIFAVFTLFYNAAFGIYILTGSIFSLITTPLVTLITDAVDKRVQEKEKNKVTVSYSRK